MNRMKPVYQYKKTDLSIKDIDTKIGIVTGYFSAFNVKDSARDIVKPGAFAKTIMEQGPDSTHPRIKHLLNHDVSMPIGKLTMLKEDAYGLYYESKIGSNAAGKDFIEMVDSGLITEHSIGYRTIKENKVGEENGMGIYELLEIKLGEGSSLTGWGVNQWTPLTGTKSESEIYDRIKKLEKFCTNSTATDETIELLLLEIKQLNQYIIDIKATPAAVEAQVPVKKMDAGLILTYLSI